MCVLDGSTTLQDWLVWDKHPIRQHWDVVMDLGEPAQYALKFDFGFESPTTCTLSSWRKRERHALCGGSRKMHNPLGIVDGFLVYLVRRFLPGAASGAPAPTVLHRTAGKPLRRCLCGRAHLQTLWCSHKQSPKLQNLTL